MALTFQIEPLATVWDDRMECVREHWKNTPMGKAGEILNPDLKRFEDYEKAGWYFEFTARDENGEYAGLCGMYLTPSMHDQMLLATEDVIYLKPKYRNGRNGMRFYQFIEAEMRKRGAKKIRLTTPPGSVGERLLESLGCTREAHVYSKQLG